ncbi:MAG: hypothetical protein WBQ34_16960 [Candidatus Acidiferrales bacterium]
MVKRMALLSSALLASLLPLAHSGAAQAGFYTRNKAAIDRNPPGVKLLLRTKEGRRTFHLFETIPIELEYSSKHPETYSIELDEVMNVGGQKHKFEIEPENAVLLRTSEFGPVAFSCCESYRRYLSKQPRVLRRELTDYFRFEKAGTYRLFLTTWRVFKGPGKPDDFRPSKTPVTSNILALTILPDDPAWDAQRLAETLQKLKDPQVIANYHALEKAIKNIPSQTGQDVATANRLNQTEFVQAQKALNVLDTEAAIRERVMLMNMMTKAEISAERELGGGSLLQQPLLASTTRPDLLVAAMEARAAEPDFAPDYDYADWWARYAVLRDHRELFRPSLDEKDGAKMLSSILRFEIAEKQEIVARLESLLATKRGTAKSLTALTIKTVKADIAYQLKAKRQAPTDL